MITQPESPQHISFADLRNIRLRAQCLAPRRPRQELVEVVRTVCGVNAQLLPAMLLGLRARLRDLTLEDVDACRLQQRAIVRTWCMRGTMHLVATEDVEWMLATIAPPIVGAGWRWLKKRAGLPQAQATLILEEAYRTLSEKGPLTRQELMASLAERHGAGVKSAAAGIEWLNGMLGRTCFGPDRGARPTFVSLDAWLGHSLQLADKADHVRLAWRYLSGYGPAGPRDLAAWWGLSLGQARSAWDALADELVELNVEGRQIWQLAGAETAPATAGDQGHSVRLLPAFDEYLLGYEQRDIAVPPEFQKHVFHGGQVVPVVLVDGCAAGTWRYERSSKEMRITVTPFESFSASARDLIAEEAEDIGRFFGLKPALVVSESG